MKRNYLIIGTMVALGVVAAIIILATIPSAAPGKSGPTGPTVAVDPTDVLRGGTVAGQLAFSRQGGLWVWRGGEAHKLPIDPGKSVVANNAVRLVQPALSRDGSKLAYIRQDETFADLWVAGADGTQPRPLSSNRGPGTPRSPGFIASSLWAFQPAWSPDGTEIAFLSDVGTDDLALWTTRSSQFQRRSISKLAVGQGGLQHPGWSPQADSLVVAGYENGKSQIYTIKASSGASTRLTDQPDGAYDPAWSPDGKFIVYTVRKGSLGELWLMRSDGSNPILLNTQLSSRSPAWSPDGKTLAFLGLKEGAFELFTLELGPEGQPNGSPKQLSNGARLDGTGGLSWSR